MHYEKLSPRSSWQFHHDKILVILASLQRGEEMTQEFNPNDRDGVVTAPRARPSAREFLWRPWYAKLWWICIPIYWILIADPTRPSFLDPIVRSGYTAIANIAFLPLTAIFVLGFKFFARFFDGGRTASDERETEIGAHRPAGYPHPTIDEFDPASGPRWIGNRHRDELIP